MARYSIDNKRHDYLTSLCVSFMKRAYPHVFKELKNLASKKFPYKKTQSNIAENNC